MKLPSGVLNVSMDGQFGSTGKGALNAWLATKTPVDLAISNAAPNAGHTYDLGLGEGKKTVFHLPIAGVLNPAAKIYICAGAIVNPEILRREMEQFGCEDRVVIHPRAAVVTEDHILAEHVGTTHLASTRKGVGAALADKIRRKQNVELAQDVFPKMCRVIDVQEELKTGKTVLMEVPQGYGLSINHGLSYPHCTSRDITVAQALNDTNVHPHYLGKVYMSLRTFPIRVANISEVVDGVEKQVGYSGPFWPDSDEKTWLEMGQEPELTTVTKRIRRIATFSYLQYRDALRVNRPDVVFLNFVNYLKNPHDLREMLVRMNNCEDQAECEPYRIFGIGASVNDVYTDLAGVGAGMVQKKLWELAII